MLSREEINRYSKQVMLEDVGLLGQSMLKEAKVLVIGAGGLGAPLLQYLTSMGIGTIGIVDFDVVEISNLHRQILFTPDDAGMPKVEVTRAKLVKQNPYVSINTYPVVLSEENAEQIFADYDIIVDGCDNFLTRYTVNDICVKMGKTLVYGSILGYQGQVAVFNHKNSKHLRDLFPEPPKAEDVPNCSENGVMGHVPGIVGLYMCNLVTQLILDQFDQPNTFFLTDLKTLEIRKIRF
ncbi:HesA/MoeB/ThiF family protein [Algoriphagus sp.]|uniref:HesA/MoeB/ThiF family protein n=1 Tax=Algoriphagus sp. TaxID=1872435 RepID=UPI003F711178